MTTATSCAPSSRTEPPARGQPLRRTPRARSLQVDRDEWSRLERLALVLRVALAKASDHAIVRAVAPRYHRCSPDPAQPAQPRPVLGPALEQDAHVRTSFDVADAGERERIGVDLRLLVERRIQPRRSPGCLDERVADRHEPGAAARVDRGQDGLAPLEDETSLGGRERDQPRGFVVAPSLAEDTRAAYFASTPDV